MSKPITQTNLLFSGSFNNFKNSHGNYSFNSFTIPIKLKKIISSGGYTYIYNCLWTDDNKIYFFSLSNLPRVIPENKYFTKIENDWMNGYEIKFSNFVMDLFGMNLNNEIKDILGNEFGLLFWMKNGYLFYLNFENTLQRIETLQNTKVISTVHTSTMADRFFIKDEYGSCYIVNRSNALNEITIENEEPEFYGGTFPSDIFVTKSNKLFIKDKEQNNLFKYKESKFEKESKVIDLKCGYRHTVILLENQNIYIFGFNTLFQCGIFDKSIPNVSEPTKLTMPLQFPILSIGCSSRGTCITCKDEIIFIGETVQSEENNVKRISTVNSNSSNNPGNLKNGRFFFSAARSLIAESTSALLKCEFSYFIQTVNFFIHSES
ncbi:hypothetical protein ABK040_003207 [Willaertia magna]